MTINSTILKASKILSHRREILKTKGGQQRVAWARQVIAQAHK